MVGVGRIDEIHTILFHSLGTRPKTKGILRLWNLKDKDVTGIMRRL